MSFETRVFNHTAHKKLWTWLSENPEMGKDDWPGWKVNGGEYDKVYRLCFACEFIVDDACCDCPLIWPHNECCTERHGLYKRWASKCTVTKNRTSLALQIANLPVRDGIETI